MPRKSSQEKQAKPSSWPQYRSKHRQRSHAEAHADTNVDDAAAPAFDHTLVCDDPPRLVTTQDALGDLIAHLRSAERFGYDSEFIGEQSYFPRLCVIQVATTAQVALIDPLPAAAQNGGNGIDLTPFWELLHDAGVEKIVHAGTPDLEPVARHLNRPPQAVFDTQIAAAFAVDQFPVEGKGLGYPMSLGKLLHQIAGVDLMPPNRSLKFSQWDHRPLTAAQLRYAANDVRYLPLLRQKLSEQLQALGNSDRAREEFQSLSRMDLYAADPDSQRLKVRGVDKLSRPQRQLLRSLIRWRDAAARQHDVPVRSMLRDDVLFALASSPVATQQELKRIPGLPRPVEYEYGQAIVDLTQAALRTTPNDDERPNRDNPTGGRTAFEPQSAGVDAAAPQSFRRHRRDLRTRVDSIWTEIEHRALQLHIHPSIVTSKRELDEIAQVMDLSDSEYSAALTESRLSKGWRWGIAGPIVDAARTAGD